MFTLEFYDISIIIHLPNGPLVYLCSAQSHWAWFQFCIYTSVWFCSVHTFLLQPLSIWVWRLCWSSMSMQPIVTSQALGYPTHRLGLVVPDMKGFLDRGFSLCAVPAFCHSPGILSCMQVYVLQGSCRVEDTAEIVFWARTSQKGVGSRVKQLPESGRYWGVWDLSQNE